MFEDSEDRAGESAADPKARATEMVDELRLHAELAAVFEGNRKFDAQLDTRFDASIARDVQRSMGKLEKAKMPDLPVISPESTADAEALLNFPVTNNLTTNDYHISRRPGETVIVRWLVGDEVATFYERIQAHFDAALAGLREDEHQALEWKQDDGTKAYLDALDTVEVKIADRYLRDTIRQHKLFVLSIQTADEINIAYLCDHLMNVPAAEVVGQASAPPDHPEERELAWFYKLFSLRGVVDGVEKMCFFTYLQKTDDGGFDFEE